MKVLCILVNLALSGRGVISGLLSLKMKMGYSINLTFLSQEANSRSPFYIFIHKVLGTLYCR